MKKAEGGKIEARVAKGGFGLSHFSEAVMPAAESPIASAGFVATMKLFNQ
jgi:hypothetical protein